MSIAYASGGRILFLLLLLLYSYTSLFTQGKFFPSIPSSSLFFFIIVLFCHVKALLHIWPEFPQTLFSNNIL